MVQSDILFELSHPARIGILRLASNKEVRHSELKLASGLPGSEVTRHATRLISIGLLKKTRSGGFRTTRVGEKCLDWVYDFEYLSFHNRYFERHDIASFPAGFDAFGMLRRCDILEETMDVVNAILRINAGARNSISCILDEFNDALVAIQTEKLRFGIRIYIITRTNRRLPVEYADSRHMDMSVRLLERIPFFLVASDSEAILCLRGPGNRIDYSTAFVSGKPEFLGWCEALFGCYWQRGRAVVL